jgi:hypothetical protein
VKKGDMEMFEKEYRVTEVGGAVRVFHSESFLEAVGIAFLYGNAIIMQATNCTIEAVCHQSDDNRPVLTSLHNGQLRTL